MQGRALGRRTCSCLVYTRPPGRPLPSRMTTLNPKLRSLRAAARPAAWLATLTSLQRAPSVLTKQQACLHANYSLSTRALAGLCSLQFIHTMVLCELDSPARPAPTTMMVPLV